MSFELKLILYLTYMKIKIFVTGGTFDKEYDEIEEKLAFKKSHLAEMLEAGRNKVETSITQLMLIDSLFMTDTDREIILDHCRKTSEDRIIITHGTGTMEITARFLGQFIHDKTIILTGAMIPFTVCHSDSLFNLGSALAFVQSLPHGVYVAANGKYFHHDNVRKDTEIGVFKEIK